MTKDTLLSTARLLVQPPQDAASEYAAKRELLAAEMNRIFRERPDLDVLVGEGNRAMMEDNHRNHARFMESMFCAYDPNTLVETVQWVYRVYRAHGFRLAYWPAQLDTWVEVLKRDLSPSALEAIYPFYRWMILSCQVFTHLSDAEQETSSALGR